MAMDPFREPQRLKFGPTRHSEPMAAKLPKLQLPKDRFPYMASLGFM